jgi:serine/threonine protein kinase
MTKCVGSSAYMAPEMLSPLKKSTYNEKVDIWALGLVIHSVVMQQIPPWDDWEEEKIELKLKLPANELSKWINAELKMSKVPEKWREIIEMCLQTNPKKRATGTEVRKAIEELM